VECTVALLMAAASIVVGLELVISLASLVTFGT